MSAIVDWEWRNLRTGFVVVAALLLLQIGGWLVYRTVHEEIPPLQLTHRCLTREKLLDVRRVTDDPIAATARGGALATRIEGNGLHIAFTGSESEAERLVGQYRSIGGALVGRLEQRGRVVYLWEGLATPAGRQTVYDCFYD